MPYPLSSEVTPGQPTASAHYNNLRNDALYLGQNVNNSASLGQLLAGYEDCLALELLETDRVRVPASPASPVCIMVSGCMLGASTSVDLPTGARPAGSPAQYFVFAVRSPGSTTFSLDVNTTAAESSDRRRIGGFYWDGVRIDEASLYVERRSRLLNALGLEAPQTFGGRLSLVSGSPAADAESGGTLYYTPFLSNRVSVYGPGSGWKEYAFSELSKSLEGMPASKPADVFLRCVSGALTLELEPWTSVSVRSTALTVQDGIQVKSGSPGLVYLGTIAITETAGICADSPARRLVWNRYNRLLRPMESSIGTPSWTYTTNAFRPVTGTAVVKLEVVTGLALDGISIQGGFLMKSADGGNAGIGVGIGATDVNSAQVRIPHIHNGIGPAAAFFTGCLAEGLVTCYLLEFGNTGVTFYGSNGAGAAIRAGLTALVMA